MQSLTYVQKVEIIGLFCKRAFCKRGNLSSHLATRVCVITVRLIFEMFEQGREELVRGIYFVYSTVAVCCRVLQSAAVCCSVLQ